MIRRIGLSKRVLGLDIGRLSIQAVELSGNARKPEGLKLYVEPVPSGPDLAPEAALKQALVALRKKLVSPEQIREIVLAVPSNRVFHKTFIVKSKFKDRRRLEAVLPGEMEDQLPLEIEQVVFDFAILGSEAAGAKVFVVGSKKEALKGLLTTLKEAGLEPTRVQSSLVALGQVVLAGPPTAKPVGVLHVADGYASIGVFENGLLKVGHTVFLSRNGHGPEAQLVRNMRQVLSHSEVEFQMPVERFFMSGDLSPDDPAISRLREELGLKVEAAPPLSPATSAGGPARTAPQDRQRTLVALGSALSAMDSRDLSRLNLRQGELEYRRQRAFWQAEWKGPVLLAAVLAGAVFADFATGAIVRMRQSGKIRSQMRSDYLRLVPEGASTPAGKEVEDLKARAHRLEMAQRGAQNTPSALDILTDISRLLPEESLATIYALKIEEVRGTLEGRASSFAGAESIYQGLQTSKLLRNVKLAQTRATSGGEVQFSVSFELAHAKIGGAAR
ncbi:MAG: pilus assembly protein PilM [Nitrospirae bacterium]|nr:pilus assembly protein PilM [Nitrospirota bacterium]